jgi:hypothetical protein
MGDIASSVIGGIGSIIGGGLSAWGTNEAAETQAGAADQASALQYKALQQQRKDLAPWVKAGTNALKTYQNVLGGNTSAFYKSPDYQWTLGQGLQGIQRGASATGRLASGDYLKDVTKYAEGLASTEYGNFMNRLQSLWGTGQASAAGQAAATGSYGTQAGQNALYAGQANAAGQLGLANIGSQLTNTAAQEAYRQNYLNQLSNQNALSNYWAQNSYTPSQMNTMSWL